MRYFGGFNFSDEDGPLAQEGKLGIIYGNREDLIVMCDFFSKVKEHINNNETCHMHLRDNMKDWNKNKHIDIEVNLD